MEQDLAQFEILRQSIRQAQVMFDGWVSQQKTAMATQKQQHTAQVVEDKGILPPTHHHPPSIVRF